MDLSKAAHSLTGALSGDGSGREAKLLSSLRDKIHKTMPSTLTQSSARHKRRAEGPPEIERRWKKRNQALRHSRDAPSLPAWSRGEMQSDRAEAYARRRMHDPNAGPITPGDQGGARAFRFSTRPEGPSGGFQFSSADDIFREFVRSSKAGEDKMDEEDVFAILDGRPGSSRTSHKPDGFEQPPPRAPLLNQSPGVHMPASSQQPYPPFQPGDGWMARLPRRGPEPMQDFSDEESLSTFHLPTPPRYDISEPAGSPLHEVQDRETDSPPAADWGFLGVGTTHWRCRLEGCVFDKHPNRNNCGRCGAPRARAAVVADSAPPAPMGSSSEVATANASSSSSGSGVSRPQPGTAADVQPSDLKPCLFVRRTISEDHTRGLEANRLEKLRTITTRSKCKGRLRASRNEGSSLRFLSRRQSDRRM